MSELVAHLLWYLGAKSRGSWLPILGIWRRFSDPKWLYLRKLVFFFLLFTFILNNAIMWLLRQFLVSKTLWIWKAACKDSQYNELFHFFEPIGIHSKIFCGCQSQKGNASCRWDAMQCVNDTGRQCQDACRMLLIHWKRCCLRQFCVYRSNALLSTAMPLT